MTSAVAAEAKEQTMTDEDRRVFEGLFAPQVIALVGASSDEKKHTSRPQRSLRRHGFQGKIVPINPKRDEIFGDKAYPSLLEVPEPIDHAFIMVPAAAVPEAIEQCIQRRIPVATIYADGFAEAGPEGRKRQEELVARAQEGGVRLLGPNCSGVLSTKPSSALSVNAAIEQLDITPGSLAVISQSGSMTGGLLSRGLGRGVGFSKVVSIGNESDITVGEITDWLVDDPETGTILLFLETIRDAPRLAAAARRAVEAGKPVIAYKLGRSDVGRSLAASHTGAMAGSAEVSDAFFNAHGILRIDNLEAMFELPVLLGHHRPSQHHRVAVMSTTGGGAATVVDRLGSMGVEVVTPSDAVVDALAGKGIDIPRGPLTDLTHAGTRADVYGAVLDELVASDHCDLVLAIAGSSAQFQPEISAGPLVRAGNHGKPLAAFFAPHAPEALAQLGESDVAGFRTPESCADAIRAWSQWTLPSPAPEVDGRAIAAVASTLSAMQGRRPNERESADVFGALGIRTAPAVVVPDDAAPDSVADLDIEYPVVAKILSGDIPHKTDAGGVVLKIQSAEALAEAIRTIRENVSTRHPAANVDGVLVQKMESGLAEVILGFRRDPEVGPVIVLGAGGVLAEVYKDIAVRVAPVGIEEARSMIEQVKGLAVVRGYRGLPAGDTEALAQAVVSLSQLADDAVSEITEAEINPLLVLPEGAGVVAVDGLVVSSPQK
ncbi:acetate--CoA ligase family protein [Paenarthrobacter ureafaciens]|uniref:acetate--CoA ligase family protein n=1 Tax=Paenarthrobacter ureafaciens TaxID=37931 RepID=UPI002DBA6379|nr:acetate--CoA ligase family protein [Paenarthrobacter ureafaciens]MEC3853114.1 acetate--CoA ligase family protein [Paenarthrobacter ureafaciens]